MSSDIKALTSALYRCVGSSHRAVGRACEDFVARASSPDGRVSAIALSDGAGSCENSALGARVVSETAASFLADAFDSLYSDTEDTASERILTAVQISLAKAAVEHGIADLESLSATLVLAALSTEGKYLVCHVGDGIAVGYTPGVASTVISAYRHDGPSSITSFVTERTPHCSLKKGVGVTSILLMSDGPENFLTCSDRVALYIRFIQELSHDIDGESITSLFEELCVLLQSKGMTDDCSFALVTDKTALENVKRYAMPEALEILIGNLDISRPPKSLNESFKHPRSPVSPPSNTSSSSPDTPKNISDSSNPPKSISDSPDNLPPPSDTPNTKS